MNLNFIKLDINILDDTKIKLIRKYPDGDKLIILWIGLLCYAMKSENPGYIYVTNNMPYTTKDLSDLLGIEEKTVQMGLELFKQFNMIDIMNGGIIEIINFNKHQNLDKIERAREISRESSRKFREKQKLLLNGDGHVTSSDDTDTESDTEKEIEPDTEKETIENIITYLNETLSTNYRIAKNNTSHIKARLNEGYKEDDFYEVIDNMVYWWSKKPEMKVYLRPSTLFGNKFDTYLNNVSPETERKRNEREKEKELELKKIQWAKEEEERKKMYEGKEFEVPDNWKE